MPHAQRKFTEIRRCVSCSRHCCRASPSPSSFPALTFFLFAPESAHCRYFHLPLFHCCCYFLLERRCFSVDGRFDNVISSIALCFYREMVDAIAVAVVSRLLSVKFTMAGTSVDFCMKLQLKHRALHRTSRQSQVNVFFPGKIQSLVVRLCALVF